MEIKASAKYIRVSPRKLRLLTAGLRGLTVEKALSKLSFYPQNGRDFVAKVLKQGRANAKNNFKLDEKSITVKSIEVGVGPTFKRIDKSHGSRFDRGVIKKKTAHLFVTLNSTEPSFAPSILGLQKGKGTTLKTKDKIVDKNPGKEEPNGSKS